MEEACNDMSLLSRLDRLDFLMKYIERTRDLSRWSNGIISPIERRCVPIDMAPREALIKGSVLDRIALLERRLIQLSLEMEASIVSSSSTLYASNISSPGQESSYNRKQTDDSDNDDFYSFDGRNPDHKDEDQHELTSEKHTTQVHGDQKMKSSDVGESLTSGCKSEKKHRSTKRCRCKRLLRC